MRHSRASTSAILLLFAVFLLLPGSVLSGTSMEGIRLRNSIEALNDLLSCSDGEDFFRELEKILDIEALSKRTFGNYLKQSLGSYERILGEDDFDELLSLYRKQLLQAFSKRLRQDLDAYLDSAKVRTLHLKDLTKEGSKGYALLEIRAKGGVRQIRLRLKKRDGTWKVTDLEYGGKYLSKRYRNLCKDIVSKKYSLPVLVARLERHDYIVLEDFSSTPPGHLPKDWGVWRAKDKRKPLLYQVQIENGHHVLAAKDTGSSVIIGKFIHWNPREYPIMTWCWKAAALPPGGDERYNQTNDSAAGIYVVFSLNWMGVPKQLKYVWSSTLPVGTVGRRNMLWRPWFFVVESGEKNLGKWTFEQVDLYEHYRLKLGNKPSDRTVSVHILTDANSTHSYAEAYYADLRAWRRDALHNGRIENYCGCLEEKRRNDEE